jgi:hypothetical protein
MAAERWTIWVAASKGTEEGMWSDSETGPWRTIVAYRDLGDPKPVEVVPASSLEALQKNHDNLLEGLKVEVERLRKQVSKELDRRRSYAEEMSLDDPIPGINASVCMGSEHAYKKAADRLSSLIEEVEGSRG